MRRFLAWFVAAILLVGLSVHPGVGAQITRSDGKDGKTRLDLVGDIEVGDADRLKAIVNNVNNDSRVVATIRLSSAGGSILEAAKITEIIQFGRVSTSVLAGKTCASACFMLFAAGTEKFASYAAFIGVHGASTSQGEEAGDATVIMSRFLKALGVPPAILGKLVVTPPSDMVWLTVDDLRSMGVAMFGKPQQTLAPPVSLGPSIPPRQAPPDSPPPAPAVAAAPANAPAKAWDWNAMVDTAMRFSRQQNNGEARIGRTCQPEMRICNTAVMYEADGSDVMLRITENAEGKRLSRDICFFNKHKDVRECIEFDSKVVTKEMKNGKGDWIKID